MSTRRVRPTAFLHHHQLSFSESVLCPGFKMRCRGCFYATVFAWNDHRCGRHATGEPTKRWSLDSFLRTRWSTVAGDNLALFIEDDGKRCRPGAWITGF